MEGCLTRLDISRSGKGKGPGSVFSACSDLSDLSVYSCVSGWWLDRERGSARRSANPLLPITEVTPSGNQKSYLGRERPPTGC